MNYIPRMMTAQQFQAWLERNGLSWTAAARELDVSRSSIGNYSTGRQPVPRAVELACFALEHGAPRLPSRPDKPTKSPN